MADDGPGTSAPEKAATPLLGHGRLSYVQIPAINVGISAGFYKTVFGWKVRGDGVDHLGFSDATGDVIGAWVTAG